MADMYHIAFTKPTEVEHAKREVKRMQERLIKDMEQRFCDAHISNFGSDSELRNEVLHADRIEYYTHRILKAQAKELMLPLRRFFESLRYQESSRNGIYSKVMHYLSHVTSRVNDKVKITPVTEDWALAEVVFNPWKVWNGITTAEEEKGIHLRERLSHEEVIDVIQRVKDMREADSVSR